jgi:hypothetical protein
MKMDLYLESLELDVDAFHQIMTTTKAVVGGSAPLSVYLKEHGLESFEPGDMDIFVGNHLFPTRFHGRLCYRFNCTEWTNFLVGQRYRLIDDQASEYGVSMNHIVSVQTWMRKTHKIQVVLVTADDIYQYMVENMDLSVCMTWWTPLDGLRTYDAYYTLRREFYVLHGTKMERIEKYVRRGFVKIEDYVQYMVKMDEREEVKIEEMALDVIRYEEVSVRDFLRESVFHIVVKVAGQWSAYRRKELVDYMMEHAKVYDGRMIYETPFRQGVMEVDILMYGDYSIYELEPIENQERTVYCMRGYSAESW